MTIARVPFALLLTALLAGCKTFQISTDFDPAANFGRLHSYDWTATPQRNASDPLVDTDTLLRQRVISAVDGVLNQRGYRRTSQNPDFLVTFYFTRDRKVDVPGVPYAPVYGAFFGGLTMATGAIGTIRDSTVTPQIPGLTKKAFS